MDSNLQIIEKKIYGGSYWYSEAGTSSRFISVIHEFDASLPAESRHPNGHNAKARFQILLAWLDYESPEGPITDLAIGFNITHMGSQPDKFSMPVGYSIPQIDDLGIYVYVPERALNVLNLEYKQGRSFVNTDFTVDVTPDVTYVVYAAIVSAYVDPFGAQLVLLAAGRTIASVFKYYDNQQLAPYGESEGGPTYRKLWASGSTVSNGLSDSEILFLQIKPVAAMHCGALKIVVVNYLYFWDDFGGGFVAYTIKLTTTIIVPYFVKD